MEQLRAELAGFVRDDVLRELSAMAERERTIKEVEQELKDLYELREKHLDSFSFFGFKIPRFLSETAFGHIFRRILHTDIEEKLDLIPIKEAQLAALKMSAREASERMLQERQERPAV